MTHSLHRRGDVESLRRDYVLLFTPAAGINHEGSHEKLEKIVDIVAEAGPTNIGSYDVKKNIYDGITIEDVKKNLRMSKVPRVRCCFSDKNKVLQVLKKVKEGDFGISVTVSGLIDEVLNMSKEINCKPHSINLSLGVWGRTEKLPDETIMEIVTMCGHGLLSKALVKKEAELVRKGKKSIRQAAEELARPCTCGSYCQIWCMTFKRHPPLIGL
ncbi:MAG TPA: hypothetical protein PKX18_09270, partial [Thermosynergistes sp.]|nr:hypothetical protein [Thermosynergistes sp.]